MPLTQHRQEHCGTRLAKNLRLDPLEGFACMHTYIPLSISATHQKITRAICMRKYATNKHTSRCSQTSRTCCLRLHYACVLKSPCTCSCVSACIQICFKKSLTLHSVLAYGYHLVTFFENTGHIRIGCWFNLRDKESAITVLLNLEPHPRQWPGISWGPIRDAGAWRR